MLRNLHWCVRTRMTLLRISPRLSMSAIRHSPKNAHAGAWARSVYVSIRQQWFSNLWLTRTTTMPMSSRQIWINSSFTMFGTLVPTPNSSKFVRFAIEDEPHTRLRATYNCPCAKKGHRRSMSTRLSIFPWHLFTDVAKETLTGNWVLVNLIPSSSTLNFILGSTMIAVGCNASPVNLAWNVTIHVLVRFLPREVLVVHGQSLPGPASLHCLSIQCANQIAQLPRPREVVFELPVGITSRMW